jgi:hypothetical protein
VAEQRDKHDKPQEQPFQSAFKGSVKKVPGLSFSSSGGSNFSSGNYVEESVSVMVECIKQNLDLRETEGQKPVDIKW